MKKCLTLFTLLVLLAGTALAQQDPMMKFTKTYFRSNPFITSFGEFVQHVMADPDLKDVKKKLRTDSTLFVFGGTFSNYNPFHFKPARVDIALLEQNVQLYEERPEGDTIMLYVLIAYADSTPKGIADLKKEYTRIQRKTDRYFFDRKEEEIVEGNVTGMASNYFVDYAQLAPVSLEWVEGVTKAPIMRLTVRIRSRGNEAVLPMSLYDVKSVTYDWFDKDNPGIAR